MQPVITLHNVQKSYGHFHLDISDLEIHSGYITGFIGENGAGKTTTIRMLMDMVRPDSGEIRVFGGDMQTNPQALKQQIGFVDSLSYFNGFHKVAYAKKILAPFYRGWDEELYQSYIKRFRLPQDVRIKNLSSGQSKLFSLTMALCHHPKLLLLDEPTANLDPVVRSEILDILAELMEQDEEISIFYSTHITSDLDKTADYVVYLHDGRVLLHEEKDRILDRYGVVKGDNALLEGESHPLLTGIRRSSVGFSALCRDRAAAAQAFGDGVDIQKPNLEDIMIYLSKEESHHA